MRILGLGAVLAALMLTLPGSAQQQAGQFFTGVNPRNIKTVPIDTTKAMRPINANRAFHAAPQQKPFSVNKVFPKISLGSWPPKRANTPILKGKDNPYQPNPIVGRNPFDPPAKKK